jgi:hypothetical protein
VAWDVIDELVCIHQRVTIEEFTDAVLERMDLWENHLLSTSGVKRVIWRHWSDSSALRFNAGTGKNTVLDVRKISDGRIVLNTVMKHGGSVKARVGLLKRLLHEDRIRFSSQLRYCIKMLRELKKGTSKVEIIPDDDPNKHVFDALTYLLSNECPMDVAGVIQRRMRPTIGSRSIFVPA